MHIPEQLFAALGHEVRLRCLLLLQREGELCVCELTHGLDLAQPTISRHLAHLREAGWVEDHRQGLWVYYRVSSRLPAWVREVLATTAAGIVNSAPFAGDLLRLGAMPNRPGARGCA
nr:metalloregulator ArsR/SmtB family transcription factor [Thiohalomonas denitrificans]